MVDGINCTAQDKFGNPESKTSDPVQTMFSNILPTFSILLGLLHVLTTQNPSQWLLLFLLIAHSFFWAKGAGACLPLRKRRESFNILFCILLPQITLSNLRLAGNLEILTLIRRISIAKGEGALGHTSCVLGEAQKSPLQCSGLKQSQGLVKWIQKTS